MPETPDDGSRPSTAAAWWALIVLTVIYTQSFVDRTILGLLVAPIRRDLGISDTGMSLLLGVSFTLFYTFLGLPMGRLADRVSRKWMVACGTTLWSLATTLGGAVVTFWQLFAARIAVGVGELSLTPAAHSLLADLFPLSMRGRAFSIYHLAVAMGQGAALLVGGLVIRAVSARETVAVPLLGAIRSWQVVFLIVGLPGLVLALTALTMREPSRRHQGAMPSYAESFAFLREHKRAFVFFILGVSLYSIVLFGYPLWMPTVFIRKFGMSAGDVGPIYGAILLVVGPLGMLMAGGICDALLARGDREAYWKVVTAIGVLGFPFAVAAPLMPTKELAFAVLAFEVFTIHAFSGPCAATLVAAVPPRLRGQISGLYLFAAATTGFGIGPTFIAIFTDYVYRSDAAVNLSLATACAIVLPLGVFSLWLCRRPLAATLERVATDNFVQGVR